MIKYSYNGVREESPASRTYLDRCSTMQARVRMVKFMKNVYAGGLALPSCVAYGPNFRCNDWAQRSINHPLTQVRQG